MIVTIWKFTIYFFNCTYAKKNLYEINSCVNNDILNGVHILEYTVNLNCKCNLFFMIYKRNPNTESNDYKITVPI